MRHAIAICNAVVLALAAGCASASGTSKRPTVVHTGDLMVDLQAELNAAPPRDRVLWEYRIAAAAMRLGRYDDAKPALDDALRRINNIMGPDKTAQIARSNFNEESKKTFIGEPYERVMANFYRGILYWRDGEVDNARACFLNAQFQDSDAEKKEYSSDYVLMDYLDGLAMTRLGGDGSDALKRAAELNKNLTLPAPDPGARVLIFTEFGDGPTKFATGKYRERLRFRPGTSNVQSARVTIGGQTAALPAFDNLNFQATTRGGRQMDYVLANKAVFKGTTSTVGDAALITGAAVGVESTRHRNETGGWVGLGLFAFGLMAKGVSASTTPAADTRCWDNLPQYLSFAAVKLPPGKHTAKIEFLDAQGATVSSRAVEIEVTEGTKDTVVFVSSKNN